MRLSIDHRTSYRFSQPQARIVQLLRLTPSDTDDQAVAAWRIDVDCDARLKEGQDGFGNRITMLYADGPIDGLEIAVSGEVLTGVVDGRIAGAPEPLPPPLFLRSTEHTRADEAITAFAGEAGDASSRDGLVTLARRFHDRFAHDLDRPRTWLPVAKAFERETATPRDMAQMYVAAIRTLGVPARYVSGHCLTCFIQGERATAHGWAEAWLEGEGWIGVDPFFGHIVDENYVRVAHGLDAAQAAPVAGSRLGEGSEWLDVDIQVERLNGSGDGQ